MRSIRLSIAVGILVTACALCVAACGGADSESSATGSSPVDIRIGNIPTSGLVILHTMLHPPADLKLDGASAYKTTEQSFAGTPDILQGLSTGSLDAGAVGATAMFPALEKGIGLLITGELFELRSGGFDNSYFVKKGSGINGPEDMRGKTMATTQVGSPAYWIGVAYLKRAGLEPKKDYKVATVPNANMLQALDAGHVDMAPMILPFLNQARAETDKYQELFPYSEVQDPYVQSLLVFNKKFAAAHRDAVKAFLADWSKTAKYVNDPANHENVVKVVSDVTKVPAKSLDYVATKNFYYLPPSGSPDLDAIQKNWDWFRKFGGVDKAYIVRDYVDPGLLPQ